MTSQVMTKRVLERYARPMTTTVAKSASSTRAAPHAERKGAAQFGSELRAWRIRRSMSQGRLADQAEVSTRHLSCLETGRATPSRDMVLVLASALELPLRSRNELLAAAGFTAAYRQDALSGPTMAHLNHAIDQLLKKLDPYPAVVVDRGWNVLRMNDGAQRFLPLLLPPDVPIRVASNLLLSVVHPAGCRPYLVNWEEVVRSTIERAHLEVARDPEDSDARTLLTECLGYPGVAEALHTKPSTPMLPFLPVHMQRDGVEARFFTMITTIGTPMDVTAEELAVEAYFPADDATRMLIESLTTS